MNEGLTCANCGRSLEGTVCDSCDSDDREVSMTPGKTRAAGGTLKVIIVAATLAMILLPNIIDRLKAVDERTWLIAFTIVAGVLLIIVLFKALVTSNDERL